MYIYIIHIIFFVLRDLFRHAWEFIPRFSSYGWVDTTDGKLTIEHAPQIEAAIHTFNEIEIYMWV